jgi:hypothetical protein
MLSSLRRIMLQVVCATEVEFEQSVELNVVEPVAEGSKELDRAQEPWH